MKAGALAPVPDILDEGALTIYVDGSMRKAPRRGGIGVHFVWVNDAGHEETWDHALPATLGATNNEMGLEAPTEALELADHSSAPFDLAQFNKIVIRTDSLYVYRNWTNAAWTWRDSKWTTKSGAIVINSVSWKTLIRVMKRMGDQHRLVVHFEWVKGKKGKHATIVDKLAKRSSDSPSFGQARPHLIRRKKSRELLERGSVRVTGQTMTIHVVTARYLRTRGEYLYIYEVVGDADPFRGKVDEAQSDANLDPGHMYVVRMNDQQQNPRIVELIRELVEDLTPYFDALHALGKPSTARQLADEFNQTHGLALTSEAVKQRLNRLVESGQVKVSRAKGPGRPYLYVAGRPPIAVQGDA